MSCALEVASPDGPLHRLGRRPDPWAWPDWAYAGPDGTFGNRYDDPAGEFRVLYASSTRFGALVETLSRFREDPELQSELAAIKGEDDDVVGPRQVPGEWLAERTLGTAAVQGRFASIGQSKSLAALRKALGKRARELGIKRLDGSAIRLRVPRAFTQAVSRHVFECEFAGVHYLSRFGDDIDNWAIHEPPGGLAAPIDPIESEPVAAGDETLTAALHHLALELV